MTRDEVIVPQEAYQKEWKKKADKLEENQKRYAEQIDILGEAKSEGDRYAGVLLHGKEFEKEGLTLASEYMKKHYSELVELFVPKEYLADYYYIIDKLPAFPYANGPYRRTVRSKEYAPWFIRIFELLNAYKLLDFFGGSIPDYLAGNMTEELLKFQKFFYWYNREMKIEYLIAARIDAGDGKIIDMIREMILGDNNTVTVSTEVIRGILMSDNDDLHQLLSDFLLAAKLQEGIRQAICENADSGTATGFKAILKTVYENNLIRFSAVKRAVATWTGICDLDNVDRISEKILESVWNTMQDFPAKAEEYVKTNDSILIMCGLWAFGFYDVRAAIKVMDGYVQSGTKNQLLTMGYYNTMLQYKDYARITATKIFLSTPEDYELLAVFLPTFLENASGCAYDAIDRSYGSGRNDQKKNYQKIPLEELYTNKEEAYTCFDIMRNIYQNIPKKKLEFSPVIFPWYGAYLSKTQLIIRMCVTAYALEDLKLKDECCGYLSSIDVNEDYTNRSIYLELLTHDLYSETARKTLLEAVADKESYTRDAAFGMVEKMELRLDEYLTLEGFLRFKTSDIRRNVLNLLNMQEAAGRLDSAKRLLESGKTELRMGGLTMLQDFHQNESLLSTEEDKKTYAKLIDGLHNLEKVAESEQVLIDELSGDGKASEILNEEGYGLYHPSEICKMEKPEEHPDVFKAYFEISKETLDTEFEKLAAFYVEHGMLEYTTNWGDKTLLMNGLSMINNGVGIDYPDVFPFKELWIEYYEKEIHDKRLIQLMNIATSSLENDELEDKETYHKTVEKLIGSTLASYKVTLGKKFESCIVSAVNTVVNILAYIYKDEQMYEASKEIMKHAAYQLTDRELWYLTVPSEWQRRNMTKEWDHKDSLFHASRMAAVRNKFHPGTEEEWKEWFIVCHDFDLKFKANENENSSYVYSTSYNHNTLDTLHYVKAFLLGLVTENEIYKAAFDYSSLGYTLESLSKLLLDDLRPYEKKQLALSDNTKVKEKAIEIYEKIINKVLDVELKRGDLPTAFSSAAGKVKRIYGMDRFVQILLALGKETLDRSTYYFGTNGDSKKVVLSHLLSVCYPKKEDTAEGLKEMLSKTKISKERLYEVMMYAPQWIDIIEEYLGENLKSACYYFMAHMNERFDDKKKAVIAKYTPLSEEELNNGAFDVAWFESAYKTLGVKTFDSLYTAAKYISDGSKHTRARKYADAALNRVKVSDLEKTIQDKRNKDLLMSYGIVPIKDDKDALHRYEFIEAFRKESRQFGAQRKASEGIACDMALKNMATGAGYRDVTRLVLAMETKLVEANQEVLKDHAVGEVTLKLEIGEEGKAQIVCVKNGKQLKSVPASLKKDEYLLSLKEIQTKWKDQYSRTVKMMEQAMEERESYTFKELKALLANPVIAPIIKSLVYVACEKDGKEAEEKIFASGLLSDTGLINYENTEAALKDDTLLRVAHPFDLYKLGCWAEYQKNLFDKMQNNEMRKQPFKQVFRELYVKLPEELDEFSTRMFAGNQIQPQKTVGCLKNRRWIADYDEGLQKVYYKDNMIVKLYALADWFSPSDVEAPTLEWVEFSDRKTFQAVKISEIPDIIYSEVMRDVDLAVSVAHVGGVDPETSHSTIEMREVIIRHNLPLFKLTNVTFEGSHAIIKGMLATYSIHLGSGVIHKLGSHQINVLPVHSESRGKLFLPFVDEDPKTAEIMGKIVLFAKDEVIKDPYILEQLK